MFLFTYGRGMPDKFCIHVWKNHTRKMYVSTFGKGMLDRSWYSHMEEECERDVCIHIWKRNTR